MKLVPVFIEGDVALAEVAEIFRAAGWHVRLVGSQIIAARVPSFLRHEAPATNVVKMPRAKVRGSR